MHTTPLILSFALLTGAFLGAPQDQEPKRVPLKNGDTIMVKGCLKGPMLESADARPTDGGPLHSMGLTFQLKGKKDLLKELIAKHDGQLVEITGVLKSNIESATPRGVDIGKTRIVVGVQSASRDRGMTPGPQELLPVLEVKSFESADLNCRR
jgi:hypothetical protein